MIRKLHTTRALLLLCFLGLAAGVFSVAPPATAETNTTACPITIDEPADIMSLAYNDQIEFSTFSVDPTNNVLITVTNNTNCSFPLSLGAYRVYDQLPSTQELHDSQSKTVPAQESRTLLVSLPTCMSQIDLYHDPDQDGPPNPPTYANPKLIGWTFQLNNRDIAAENDMFHFDDGHPYQELDRFPGDDDDGFSNVPQENRCTDNPPLQAQCSVSPDPAETGETVEWSAINVSGGDGEYSFIWSGDATGNQATVEETYATTGEKQAEVLVTSGNQQLTPQCEVGVESGGSEQPLNVSCQVSPSTASTSDPVAWSVDNVTGGSGDYSYSWAGDASGNTESVTESYTATGTKQATVTVTDENENTQDIDQCQMVVSDNGGGGGGGGGSFDLSLSEPFSWLVSNSTLRSTKTGLDLSAFNGFDKEVTLTAASGLAIENYDTKFIHDGGSPQDTISLDPADFSDPLNVYVRDSIDSATYPVTVTAQSADGQTEQAQMTLYVRSYMEF